MKIKVAHLPHNVGNHAYALSRAERLFGFDSKCFVSEHNYTKYPYDEMCWDYSKLFLIREVQKWLFLFRLILFYDIIHFNFGKKIFSVYRINPSDRGVKKFFAFFYWIYCKIFQEFDLYILRFFGKKIFVTFQGDDARQGNFCRDNFPIHFVRDVHGDYYKEHEDQNKIKIIKLFDKYCDQIFYLNPDLSYVLPSRSIFIPYLHVDTEKTVNNDHTEKKPKIIFMHAPTHRLVKGSNYIINAIKKLEREGFNCELILIENMTYEHALLQYAKADVCIDQILTGWYGGVAVETMSMGKPTVCYIRDSDLHVIPTEMRNELPLINASPSDIYDVLKGILIGEINLDEASKRSLLYVKKWHSVKKIAQQIIKFY